MDEDKKIDQLHRSQRDRKFTKNVLNLHWKINSKSDRDVRCTVKGCQWIYHVFFFFSKHPITKQTY